MAPLAASEFFLMLLAGNGNFRDIKFIDCRGLKIDIVYYVWSQQKGIK